MAIATFAEDLIEYAGRVCYRSADRMSTAPGFIQDRIREGHEDIIEHAWASVQMQWYDDFPATLRQANRYVEVKWIGEPGLWLVSGNLRVWRDLFRRKLCLDAAHAVRSIAPTVFADLPDPGRQLRPVALVSSHEEATKNVPMRIPLWMDKDGSPMRVAILGHSLPRIDGSDLFDGSDLLRNHGAATFLFEGISRACTHQLVRHRLASFSQESQRYVDLSKGGWRAIVPPAIAAKPLAMAEMEDFWRMAEDKYATLRSLGIRKEDARFLLPNAAETRIVVTMNFAAWQHFLALRLDKAAQWEIRQLAEHTRTLLARIVPELFEVAQ